ncbi:hypothetical protein L208DRAFT_1413750 [Tricholoma matsutake]|nr:hypothetical protein L208DRAFT_1413750 [Tricholoma matsutake 945]
MHITTSSRGRTFFRCPANDVTAFIMLAQPSFEVLNSIPSCCEIFNPFSNIAGAEARVQRKANEGTKENFC